MQIDASSLAGSTVLRGDVCVVGAGPAGLTLAEQMAACGMRVVLLESGSSCVRSAAQQLSIGSVVGAGYHALHECRRRAVGGTSHVWGGWCRPLDALDFEAQAWLPHSGWPFGLTELQPFYARAQQVCKLGRFAYDLTESDTDRSRGRGDSTDPSFGPEFERALFQVRPTRFGEQFARHHRDADRVQLVCGAVARDLALDERGQRVRHLQAVGTTGRAFRVVADSFVLAGGGIENARMLLACRSRYPNGIGNEHDLVGRYFMDHLHVPLGTIELPGGVPEAFRLHDRGDVAVRGVLALSSATRRRARLLGFASTLHCAVDPHDTFTLSQTHRGYSALQSLVHPVRRARWPEGVRQHAREIVRDLAGTTRMVYRRIARAQSNVVLLGYRAEQAPDPDNRILLGRRLDAYGVPEAQLHWRITEQDAQSAASAAELLRGAWEQQGVLVRAFGGAAGGERGIVQTDGFATGAHHMGTTRMHTDARQGVVNEHCQVHGVANLFIAGSSVFPTGGWAPPTLTIVALAIRLADHLQGSTTDANNVPATKARRE